MRLLSQENCALSNFNLRLAKFSRRALSIAFGFDRWHISLLPERQYALDIIEYLNGIDQKDRMTVIEIGCGLGDIIRNLRYMERFGFDRDKNVIKAATFISKLALDRNIRFEQFVYPQTQLIGKYDVIIMVNWIHNVSTEALKNGINLYFHNNLNKSGRIIVDVIHNPEYKYNHDVNAITKDLTCSIIRLGSYSFGREVYCINNKYDSKMFLPKK